MHWNKKKLPVILCDAITMIPRPETLLMTARNPDVVLDHYPKSPDKSGNSTRNSTDSTGILPCLIPSDPSTGARLVPSESQFGAGGDPAGHFPRWAGILTKLLAVAVSPEHCCFSNLHESNPL